MKQTHQMYMVGQYINFQTEELHTAIEDWIVLLRLLSNPKTMQINDEEPLPFVAEEVVEKLQQVSLTDKFWWKISSDTQMFEMHISNGSLFFRNIIDEEVFFHHEHLIFDYFDARMSQHGLYGYVRSYDEFLYHNVSEIEERLQFETMEEIDLLPKMYDDDKNLVVDCNLLSGYDVFFKGLCLTSCWKMYYSKYHFQLLPKPIFLEAQKIEEVRELENDCLLITLYKNPSNWQNELNQNYQFLFRAQMGFDQLVWNNGIGVLREPYMEYAFADEVIHTVQYLNDYGQPIEKKKATTFITRTVDTLRGTYDEHRIRGRLNAQAYFPFVDEMNRKMMNFRVLNPEYSLDGGIRAYEFYIREFLDLSLEEDYQYKHFQSILNFYLPHEDMKEVPIEQIKEKFPEVDFKKISEKRKTLTYDLRKGENHLRVVFSNTDQMQFYTGISQQQST